MPDVEFRMAAYLRGAPSIAGYALGIGVFMLPSYYEETGYSMAPMILLIASLMMTHSVYNFSRIMGLKERNLKTYQDVATYVMGPKGHLWSIILIVTYQMAGIIYLMDLVRTLAADFGGIHVILIRWLTPILGCGIIIYIFLFHGLDAMDDLAIPMNIVIIFGLTFYTAALLICLIGGWNDGLHLFRYGLGFESAIKPFDWRVCISQFVNLLLAIEHLFPVINYTNDHAANNNINPCIFECKSSNYPSSNDKNESEYTVDNNHLTIPTDGYTKQPLRQDMVLIKMDYKSKCIHKENWPHENFQSSDLEKSPTESDYNYHELKQNHSQCRTSLCLVKQCSDELFLDNENSLTENSEASGKFKLIKHEDYRTDLSKKNTQMNFSTYNLILFILGLTIFFVNLSYGLVGYALFGSRLGVIKLLIRVSFQDSPVFEMIRKILCATMCVGLSLVLIPLYLKSLYDAIEGFICGSKKNKDVQQDFFQLNIETDLKSHMDSDASFELDAETVKVKSENLKFCTAKIAKVNTEMGEKCLAPSDPSFSIPSITEELILMHSQNSYIQNDDRHTTLQLDQQKNRHQIISESVLCDEFSILKFNLRDNRTKKSIDGRSKNGGKTSATLVDDTHLRKTQKCDTQSSVEFNTSIKSMLAPVSTITVSKYKSKGKKKLVSIITIGIIILCEIGASLAYRHTFVIVTKLNAVSGSMLCFILPPVFTFTLWMRSQLDVSLVNLVLCFGVFTVGIVSLVAGALS